MGDCSGVKSVRKQIHIVLEPSFLNDINFGILKYLNQYLNEYFPEVSGILLGYKDIKLKKSTENLFIYQPHIHVDIQATFFIFCPSPGSYLLGTVNEKSECHIGVLVHDTFSASIPKTGIGFSKYWVGSKVTMGAIVKFKILTVGFNKNGLEIQGLLDNENMMHVGVTDTIVKIIEEVSDFDGDDVNDRGVENGVSTCASSSKRKWDEIPVDEVERKRRKKAEKKARKEKERLEKLQQMNGEDTLNESNSGKSKLGLSASFTPILEPDLMVPNSLKSKEKSVIMSPMTKKENFELPEGFKVIEKKTEKNSWKIYQGPDGKNYRSMAEIKRYIEGKSYNDKNLAETIEYVATEWNCSDKGDLGSDMRKFNSKDFKDFPKSDLYFVDLEGKPSPAKKALIETSKADTVVTDTIADSTSINVSHEDTSASKDKKKKKKKKNKHKESTME